MSEHNGRTESFPDNVNWSHDYDFPDNGKYSERNIILSTREGLVGLFCGSTKILTERGYCGWVHKGDIHRLPKDAHLIHE